ncbi:MAG: CPBP family intramembrane glutamic endopeptidase [Ilumatobacteraceae bacterium]
MTVPGRLHRSTDDAVIPVGPASAAWAIGWVLGTVAVAPVVVAAFGASLGDDLTVPQLAAVVSGGWLVFVVALFVVSRRRGTGSFVADYAIRFRWIDLLGVPLGVVTQLALVPLLYVPLRWAWPETFTTDEIEQRARDLADRAGGWLTVLLVVVVVIGAPIVEEIVYRGLLQRSLSGATGPVIGLVGTSVWFALIHLSPIEYPGLFLAGLVFGACVALTGRIGPSIVTHAAFNATGLLLVLHPSG